jgi:hypothetical protein
MRKKLFMAMALIATMAFGCILFESSSYAQNTNSSTTSDKHMSGNSMGRRRHRRQRWHRRWPRRHRRGGKM